MNTPDISIITTCKSRLAFLKQSLPRMAMQPDVEVIVVDYDCPEGAGDWVKAHFPQMKLVSVSNAPVFNAAHARNLGAAAARGRWLCFVDADVLLDDGFVTRARDELKANAFYVLTKARSPAQGTVICAREDFSRIHGYDETLRDYGMEDHDLYMRLKTLGRRHQVLATQHVSVLDHSTDLRMQNFEIKDRRLSTHINAMYVYIKHDLMRQLGVPDLAADTKKNIYEEIRRAFLSVARTGNDAPVRVEVTLPPMSGHGLHGRVLQRTWVYTLQPASDSGEAN